MDSQEVVDVEDPEVIDLTGEEENDGDERNKDNQEVVDMDDTEVIDLTGEERE